MNIFKNSKTKKFVLFFISILLLTFGVFMIINGQGVEVEAKSNTYFESLHSSIGGGFEALILSLPFTLCATLSIAYLVANKKVQRNIIPYIILFISETIFILGFLPYPQIYHNGHQPWEENTLKVVSGSLLYNPSSYIPICEFFILFLLLFFFFLSLWFLIKPDDFPFSIWKNSKRNL
ncbi:MAG: hypothetical protein L6265_09430 [Thermoplasmatales archaeon]|nr:hypothetical protein [Thermoplasmatales archaeon]